MKITLVSAALLLAATPARQPLPKIYQIDPAHGGVSFSVRLVGFNRVRGSFPSLSGHVTYDPAHPERSSASVVITVASVSTGSSDRDRHLKSAEFFDADRFPVIRFRSTSVRQTPSGLSVAGDLTIRDVTRRVLLPVTLLSAEAIDPFGNRRVAWSSTLTVNRRDFGVIGPPFWNRAISDSVELELEIPGRVWGYDRLGFRGRPGWPSIGRLLLERIDSAGLPVALREARELWHQPARDSAANFSAFQWEVAAGRLEQRGQLRDALAVLVLATETVGSGGLPSEASWLFALRARLERILGHGDAAATSVARALELDSANTLALELNRPSP